MSHAITPSQQLASLNQRLIALYVERDGLDERRQVIERDIAALRNLIAGAGLGREVEREESPKVTNEE